MRELVLNPTTLIRASAGSGKTYRLAAELVAALTEANPSETLEPASVLATTFTNKAADELVERIRLKLLDIGELEKALLVQTAYIGTVNSVCGQLIEEFCFEGGLSPHLSVLPANRVSLVFSRASTSAIASLSEEAEQAAFRLTLSDWYETVSELTTLARANGISATGLQHSAKLSWRSIQDILPPCNAHSSANLDSALADAIDKAIISIQKAHDFSKKTKIALRVLKEKHSAFITNGELTWSDWAQLAKLSPAKASQASVENVIAAAAMHPFHPRLHNDIQTYLNSLFACASVAMTEYENYKRIHALIDFSDQEYLLLKILDHKDVQAQISDRIKLLLVDEFQDTSPVQLAIFVKLAGLVKRSMWVGDEKQAIYGFRGTDSLLLQTLANNLQNELGLEELSKSYRSRPELVAFTNDVFIGSFSRMGLSEANVLIKECKRVQQNELSNALGVWCLEGKNWSESLTALANAIAKLLQSRELKVEDPASGEIRVIRASDLAILCRSNERCLSVAGALSLVGTKVACRRTGLLETPECVLAFAALRFLVDNHDTLAAAEIIHLTNSEFRAEQWLEDWLVGGITSVLSSNRILQCITDARRRISNLTPLECLELSLSAANVLETVQGWTAGRQRLANLDSMRGLAREYEEFCLARRAAATPAGFVAFLLREVRAGGEQAPFLDTDAVNVLTYHGAKGLEWPLVILLDLEKDPDDDSDPFGICVESENRNIDVTDPLKGRWIRCWPWPYGLQKKDVFLDSAVANCPERLAALRRAREEAIRLLYVGMTRARDYLIFASRANSERCAWLDMIVDLDGDAILQFPEQEGFHQVKVNSGSHNVMVEKLRIEEMEASVKPHQVDRALISTGSSLSIEHLPYRLVASRTRGSQLVNLANSDLQRARLISIGRRLPVKGKLDMELLGEVMHRFLAADHQIAREDLEQRVDLASRLCERWSISAIESEFFIEASDNLRAFIARRYPDSVQWTEFGVSGRFGLQRCNGRVDLLLEMPEGFAIIDHKTFPGRFNKWVLKAISYLPQLIVYSELVSKATGKSVISQAIHMPVVGAVVEIQCIPPSLTAPFE